MTTKINWRRSLTAGNKGLGQKWIRNELRCAVYARDGFVCVYCGILPLALVIDHVVPRSEGGGNEPDNLATSCHLCNESKGDRSADAWFLAREAVGEDISIIRTVLAQQLAKPVDRMIGRLIEDRRPLGSFAAARAVWIAIEQERLEHQSGEH